jgi:glyoxylase I family protein
MPELVGISHIDLTVSDCRRAADWWHDVMGFTLVNHQQADTYETMSLVHPSAATVTVMTHDGTAGSGPFDERRVGLDHLAFRVADRNELERWATYLETKGVPHSGLIDTGFGPTVVFRDPDNIQLEFYVHPGADQVIPNAVESDEARRVLGAAQAGTD